MERTLQQETDSKGQNEEEQGGIRCRLRDRELLKRRKAEAEGEKTSQWVLGLESLRKRQRAEGAKRRGRARKTADFAQSSFTLEGSDVVMLPKSEEVIAAPAPDPLEAESFLSDAPWVASVTTPGLGLALASTPDVLTAVPPAPSQDESTATALTSEPVSVSASAPDLTLEPVSDLAPQPTPDPVPQLTLAPDPAPEAASDFALDRLLVFPQSQAPVSEPASVSSVIPPQVEAFMSSHSQVKETLDQVVIEDVGPDDEKEETEVQSASQDKKADKDTSKAPSNNEPGQNEIFTIPSLSSLTTTQGYFPGN